MKIRGKKYLISIFVLFCLNSCEKENCDCSNFRKAIEITNDSLDLNKTTKIDKWYFYFTDQFDNNDVKFCINGEACFNEEINTSEITGKAFLFKKEKLPRNKNVPICIEIDGVKYGNLMIDLRYKYFYISFDKNKDLKLFQTLDPIGFE